MKCLKTYTCAALLAVLMIVSAQAQIVHPPAHLIAWQGGNGTLTDANYTDGTSTNLSPQPTTLAAADHVYIGSGTTIATGPMVTFTGTVGFGRLRVGTNTTPPGNVGAATLTLTGAGTLVQLDDGDSNPDGALWVGQGNNGVLNIKDAAELKANRLVVIGAGNNNTATGTLNIDNGGILTVSDGNLSIADRSGTGGTGIKGVVNISGATSRIDIKGPSTDLVVGPRARVGTYNQTDGTVTVVDTVDLAGQSSDSNNTGSSFSISGGSITTGTTGGGNFLVGRGASKNATVNISGTGIVNVGNRFLMGGTDGATTPTARATGVVTNQSGGTLNTDLDIRVADTFIFADSDATYNLSGTGIINTNTTSQTSSSTIIGRQGTGKFIQTGGTANFNSPLIVGDRNGAITTTATGLYKISAGDLNVTAPTPTFPLALSIAPNGTGEFRVVGDDSTIDVTGDFAISSTANGNGTLAYEFESGDLLAPINVAGIATFNAGSKLVLDTANASPTQTSYDLLTATSIVDSGIAFTGPANWSYSIVTSGNGHILRVSFSAPAGVPGDYNGSGSVDAADYVLWRKGVAPLQNEVSLTTPGTTTVEDYTAWRARFGNSGSGAGTGVAQVPEPVGVLLWAFATVIMTSVRRRPF